MKVIAEKHNISEREVEKIVNSEFKMVAEGMKKGQDGNIESYENIMLHHFGTFHCLPKRIEKKYNKKESDK